MDGDMSAADERILSILEADSRMPAAKVAKKAGLPQSTVRRRIRRMVESGAIRRYTIERGDGRTTKAIVLVSAESSSDISRISASLASLAGGGGGGHAGRTAAAAAPRGRAKGAAGRRREGKRGAAGGGGGGGGMASISSVYEITGRHDIAVVMSAAGIAQINEAIDTVRRVPGVTDTNTVIILRTVV